MAAVEPHPDRNGIPPTPTPALAERREKFEQLLATKLEQGYDVESQGETEAVVVTRGRRRRFRRRADPHEYGHDGDDADQANHLHPAAERAVV